MASSEATLRVRFRARDPAHRLTDTPLAVPVNLTAAGLSEVVLHLLGPAVAKAAPKRFCFVFTATQQPLRGDLAGAVVQQRVDLESVVELEFFAEQPRPQEAATKRQPDWVGALAAMGTQGWFAAGCYDGVLRVHRPGDATVLATLGAHVDAIKTLAVHAGGGAAIMASSGQDRVVKVSISTSEDDGAHLRPHARSADGVHENSVEASTFVALAHVERPLLAMGDWDGKVCLWEVPSTTDEEQTSPGQEAAQQISKRRRRGAGEANAAADERVMGTTRDWKAHAQCVSGLAWDGLRMYSASYDHSLKAWDLERGDAVTTVNTTRVATGIALPPEAAAGSVSGSVAMACADGRVRLWDLRAGNTPSASAATQAGGIASFLRATLRCHNQWCADVAWDPASAFAIASACHAGRVATWDLRALDTPVHVFRGNEEKVLALSWLPGAAGIACGGSDARVRVFRAGGGDDAPDGAE